MQWHIALNEMVDLRCMSFIGKEKHEIVAAGCQRQMYRIDVEKGRIVETLNPQTPVPYTMMRQTVHCICAAAHDGSIHLLDSKTLAVIHCWKAYAGTVNDMDARGDYLLTCGWATQQYQGLGLERLVRVFDLKNLRPAVPVAFPSGAAFVRMHPKLSSTCIVASQTGVLHSIDVQNPDMPMMRFAQMFDAQLSGLEIMPSGRGFAMTDTHCHIVLWGSQAKLPFTEYSQPTEFADPAPPAQELRWSSDAPLNLVGMPYYREALLSGWPNSLVHEVGAPPPKLEQAILATLRNSDYGQVGVNPRKTRRYQIEDTRAKHKVHVPLGAPKFLSEKPREDNGVQETQRRLSEDINKTLNGLALNGSGAQADALYYYRPVEIKYSKFGIYDFDFKYYNTTRYSGLETHIVNSYANPLLQVYRFTNGARNFALKHAARDCRYDCCLLCELGFLVDMLEKAQGQNCQAKNFLRALSKQSGASTLAILEDHPHSAPLTTMIQNMNRFLLTKLDDCYRRIAGDAGEMQAVFAMSGSAFSQCTHCSYEDSRDQIWYNHDLSYPPKTAKHSPHTMKQYFSRLLKDSVEKYSNQQRGWCMRCQSYKAIRSRRAIREMPSVLMINAAIHTPEARQLWSTPGFLPREIGVIVQNGQFFCYQGQDLQLHLQRRNYDITVYELVGVVADVAAGEAQKSHLVAMVDVSVADPDPNHVSDWHLINDFLIRPIAEEEALHFDARWKLPSVLTYQAKSISHMLDDTWKQGIDTSVLYRSVTQPALAPEYHFQTLSHSDGLPDSDTHCAIDAEFVRLLREEIDMGADGTRTMIRPARSGLARVSVLRGEGADQEVPFIDDYIAVDEPVEDYLTQYSGLQPGDLTLGTSRFTLVSLKEVYKKLWVLLNLGCKFIGHGLSSDFRTINIHVPEAQVIDTQDLFSLGHRSLRKLSLRFLAWVLLREEIQQNTLAGHDSIEDARTALKLWRKHIEYEDAGVLEGIKDDIWLKGKAMDFKVATADSPRTAPNTPRRPVSVNRAFTPARLDFGSPLK